MNKIRKYTAGLLSVLCLSAASCDVLDVEPTGSYSETTAYSSLSNLDLYVKYFYGVLYANADIACGSSCLMDDGATDLVKYSWYGVSAGAMNRFSISPITSPNRVTSAPTGLLCTPGSASSTNIWRT